MGKHQAINDRSKSSPNVSSDVKEAILRSFTTSNGQLTNGERALREYKMEELISWACQSNGSTTEAILIWHIATTLFHNQPTSPQQNNDPHQESAPQENNSPYNEKEVALGLSSYCHYLVKFLPDILPDEVEWTEEIYGSVINQLKGRCEYVLGFMWDESSVAGKGIMLVNHLKRCAENGVPVWKMLAEFWAEMILFISPSDNVDGHENILDREELITQLWALLTHAGIVTRPKPTENQDHPSESRDVEQMRTMADVQRPLNTPSDIVEGNEEIVEIGDELLAHQSERIPVTGDESV